MMVCQ